MENLRRARVSVIKKKKKNQIQTEKYREVKEQNKKPLSMNHGVQDC